MLVYLLQHLLTNTARQYPDKEAVVFKGETITYAGLEEKVISLPLLYLNLAQKLGIELALCSTNQPKQSSVFLVF